MARPGGCFYTPMLETQQTRTLILSVLTGVIVAGVLWYMYFLFPYASGYGPVRTPFLHDSMEPDGIEVVRAQVDIEGVVDNPILEKRPGGANDLGIGGQTIGTSGAGRQA